MSLLKWAVILFILAVVFAILGFGGIAGALTDIAMILFWIFVVVAIIVLIMGFVAGKKVT